MMQLPVAIVLAFVGGMCGTPDQIEEKAVEWASFDAGISGLNHVSCESVVPGLSACRAFTSFSIPIVLICTMDDCMHVGFTTDMSEHWNATGAKFTFATGKTKIVITP